MNITQGHVLRRRDFHELDLTPLEGRNVPRDGALTKVLNTKVDGPTVLIGPLGMLDVYRTLLRWLKLCLKVPASARIMLAP